MERCIDCGKTEYDKPLISFRYKGSLRFICMDCYHERFEVGKKIRAEKREEEPKKNPK